MDFLIKHAALTLNFYRQIDHQIASHIKTVDAENLTKRIDDATCELAIVNRIHLLERRMTNTGAFHELTLHVDVHKPIFEAPELALIEVWVKLSLVANKGSVNGFWRLFFIVFSAASF